MIPIRWGLLKILWRQALPATIIGVLGFSVLTLVWPEVLTSRNPWAILIVIAQCFKLAQLSGRFESPTFAFLYSRGYSRDALWLHLMLTSFLSAMAAWLVAGSILWSGLRSLVQDQLQHNPFFPIMAPREFSAPLLWLGIYLLLIPAYHYVWIRRAQPTRGSLSGYFVIIVLLAALLVGFDMVYYLDGWFAWLAGASYALVVACLILGSWLLHRKLEVRA